MAPIAVAAVAGTPFRARIIELRGNAPLFGTPIRRSHVFPFVTHGKASQPPGNVPLIAENG